MTSLIRIACGSASVCGFLILGKGPTVCVEVMDTEIGSSSCRMLPLSSVVLMLVTGDVMVADDAPHCSGLVLNVIA